MRTGEIVALVLAVLALILVAAFIFLYVWKVRLGGNQNVKGLGNGDNFSGAVYRRDDDAVQIGLENPNFSAD